MDDLTAKLRRELRAKAHHLHPVVSVGQHGLTPQVLHEIDVALNAHELVKIRVHSDDRDAREAMLADIATQLQAEPVQHLGKLLIVWRERDEAETKPAPAAKPAQRPRKARPQGPRPHAARASAPPATQRRRRRGAVRTAPKGTFIGEAAGPIAAEPKRTVKPAAKRASNPVAKRVAKRASDPIAKPVAKRGTRPAAKPAAKPARPRRRRGG